MSSYSEKILLPTYQKFHASQVDGKRTVVEITFTPKINPESEATITIPRLRPNVLIDPNTICLSTTLENANNKSFFKNNIGRLLCEKLTVRFAGNVVYDNNRESLIMVYKDLWLSDKCRKDMSEYGIASENLRKLMSGDDSASASDKGDNALFNARGKKIKIKLGKILRERGLLASYGLNNNIQYVMTLPSASEIMIAQSGESVEGYSLKDVHLTYETIESSNLYNQALSEYADTDFPFEYVTHSRLSNWRKDQTDINETIDLPRKSMRAIVMLFKYADTVDSEEYIFPKIKKVEISVDGDPNAVYSKGMKTNDLYREARRVFHVEDTDMTEEKFYDNKFALVIDLRNNGDNSAIGSGYKIVNTKTGIQIAITKEATTKDVKCEIFVLSDGSVDSVERSFGRLRL